jgi:hypothetical protein
LNSCMQLKSEIKRLLDSMDMKEDNIPEDIRADRVKTYSYLKKLLSGRQKMNKQTIMVVGEGK